MRLQAATMSAGGPESRHQTWFACFHGRDRRPNEQLESISQRRRTVVPRMSSLPCMPTWNAISRNQLGAESEWLNKIRKMIDSDTLP